MRSKLHFWYILQIWILVFLTKKFKNILIVLLFLFIKHQKRFQKNFLNLGIVGHQKLPEPLLNKIFNILWIGLQYIFSFEGSFFCRVSSHNYGKILVTKSHGECNFTKSEIGSDCNSIFRPADSN